MRIALAGNPNSGKTTMYNALTGRNEKVGNWAGVTVDRKEHAIKAKYGGGEELIAVDLPGAYSMSPFTSEESITSSYVKKANPDAIINIVDATNLSRSLFFTTQLLELGIPVIVALNKADINRKKKNKIDVEALSEKLLCPIVNTVSTTGEGLEELVKTAASVLGKGQKAPYDGGSVNMEDKAAVEEADRKRFEFVNSVVSSVETRKTLTNVKNKQDKIDAVLTNKWVGIPIFALVMWLVFWISQVGPGAWLAEGYTFEREDAVTVEYGGETIDFRMSEAAEGEELPPVAGMWEADGAALSLNEDGSFTLEANGSTVSGTYTYDEEAETPLVLSTGNGGLSAAYDDRDVVIPGLVTLIEMLGDRVSELLEGSAPILQTVIVDGIIGGVGAVVGFLPLVMVMYFLLSLLEECGYMARVSVVLDPIFKRVGLSGKSVIPLVVGTGCAVPGIMACRTIRNERERRATAMLTPFIPCGAKIPVIALFAGLFFPQSNWVSPVMYFVGIILVFLGALLIKWVSGYKYRKSFFIIELPEYKWPSLWTACKSICQRGKAYIVKAATIILVCNLVVTLMLNYDWSFRQADAADSILHDVAVPFSYLLIPLGFGAWQLAAAAITGFIAKENVVGTLGACYAALAVNDDFELLQSGGGVEILGITAVAGLAYLMFNLYTPPCFAAIGAMNSEIKSKKWLFAGVGLQLAVGYTIAYFVYQIGTLATTGSFGAGALPGLAAVIAIAAIVAAISVKANRAAKREYAAA